MVFCSDKDLKRYIENAVEVDPDRPVLVDKYLDRADELDVDALCDKDGNVVICGIMQHIEQAGVHSGEAHAWSTPDKGGQTALCWKAWVGYDLMSAYSLHVVRIASSLVNK